LKNDILLQRFATNIFEWILGIIIVHRCFFEPAILSILVLNMIIVVVSKEKHTQGLAHNTLGLNMFLSLKFQWILELVPFRNFIPI